jgi:hypothetical protein
VVGLALIIDSARYLIWDATQRAVFSKQVEYGRRDACLIYKEKGEKMKRSLAIFACLALTPFFFAQEAGAFPGERVLNGTAHVAHRVAYGFNRHVVQPARRVVVRHTS